MPWARLCATGVLVATLSACERGEVSVEYRGDDRPFSWRTRRAISRIANQAFADVRRVLPSLAPTLVLVVSAGDKGIPETGETATHAPPNRVLWTVDAQHHEPVREIVETQLRATLFHELHHLARGETVHDDTLMGQVITEGLATAFERDQAGVAPPWGRYPPEIKAWVAELLALPPTESTAEIGRWMFRHPDGRRWIGFKVGTYLVDRAMAGGQSSAQLVSRSTEEIIRLATRP